MTGYLKLSSVQLGSLAVAASRTDLVPASRSTVFAGTGLSGFGTAGLGGSDVRESGMRSAMRERSERPIQAPAVVVAPAHADAAANGAEAQATWAGTALTTGDAVTIRKQQTTRAFRGLEPWRDPA